MTPKYSSVSITIFHDLIRQQTAIQSDALTWLYHYLLLHSLRILWQKCKTQLMTGRQVQHPSIAESGAWHTSLSKLTSHCPSVSKNWKLLSHTPGSVSMWTPMHWLCLSQSSLFILLTLLRRLRGSPALLPPHTGRMVLIFSGHAAGPHTSSDLSHTCCLIWVREESVEAISCSHL